MKSLLLDLPYVYGRTYVPAGRRVGRTDTFVGTVPVDIPVVDPDEAPISVTWHKDPNGRYYDDRIDVVARAFEGRCYLSLGERKPVLVEAFARRLLHHPGRGGDLPHEWWGRSLPDLPGTRPDEEGTLVANHLQTFETASAIAAGSRPGEPRVLVDDSAERADEASALWRRSVIVLDGEVWSSMPTREPRYEVRLGTATVVIVSVLRYSPDGRSSVIPFRADRRDEAVAFASAHATRVGLPLIDEADVYETTDPALLVSDDAIDLAGHLLHGFRSYRRHGEYWDRDIRLSVSAILALNRPGIDRDVPWAAQVLSAYGRFLQAVDAHPHHDHLFVEDIDHRATTYARWIDHERHLRPDIASLVADETDEVALAMGF